MSNPEQEAQMRALAKMVERTLADMYGQRMAFFLVTAPFGDGERVSDYIGNSCREDGINLMKTTVSRLEKNQDIPVGGSTAQ